MLYAGNPIFYYILHYLFLSQSEAFVTIQYFPILDDYIGRLRVMRTWQHSITERTSQQTRPLVHARIGLLK